MHEDFIAEMNIRITSKHLHEQFVSNLNGTTNTETFLAVTPNFFTVFFVCALAVETEKGLCKCNFWKFFIEFLVIVGTAILSCTLCVNYISQLVIVLFILCTSIVLYKVQHFDVRESYEILLQFGVSVRYKSYVTNFRALVSMLTCISILAVDFTVFPRRFAKTETFGYSPMDAGVGLFCFVNSIIVPSAKSGKPNKLRGSFGCAFISTLKSCVPLVILGGVRFISTKQMDYQVHVSEYGVHWNFFLTLAVSKFISFLLTRCYDMKYNLHVSFIVIGIHELMLWGGLQNWVISDIPRDNFVSANREGIVSSTGYVALFLSGIGVGNLIFMESHKIKDSIALLKTFILLSIALWTVTLTSADWFLASRRLANFGYFIWILTFSVSTITAFMTVDLLLHLLKFYKERACKSTVVNTINQVPLLFSAINYNGLAFFLFANVLTGLVNISIETLQTSEVYSIFILFMYSFVTCLIIYVLYHKNIKLKVW